jgi:hypothetical protein
VEAVVVLEAAQTTGQRLNAGEIQKPGSAQRFSHACVIASITASGLVVYSQNTCTA